MHTGISVIFSDYDGTLCPTSSIRSSGEGKIPYKLEQVLWEVSRLIPICIISSKDYHFLHPKTRFARIISCIGGTEFVSLRNHSRESEGNWDEIGSNIGNNDVKERCNNNISYCIDKYYLLPNSLTALSTNSELLSVLAKDIESEFEENFVVERKFTVDRQFLAGITIDYRDVMNWRSYKKKIEPYLQRRIKSYQSDSLASAPNLHLLSYSSHPFLDVYALPCDKGTAFDFITSEILNISNSHGTEQGVGGTLYLGDSENDNPAFTKAEISIGVRSDERLDPRLNCDYSMDFDYLPRFLKKLMEKHFKFSQNLLY